MTTPINTNDIPKEPAHRRAWVIYQLKLRGMTLRRLAFKIGVNPNAVQNALALPSSHIEREIAKALGVTAKQLFPERFGPNGERLHVTKPPKRIRASSGRNVQVSGAA
ncbi:helix-turn-helix domain-containing protein [Dongia deserti]|uniref:helix-turn-helix domain-containing protein n=1 Tax=Dongia deserti TaxID=2268030 RepID=UPI000E6578C9|nr:helix-turn-helix domain-containing protein [Dongia deserti]